MKAVDAMDGYNLGGRRMAINIAKYGWSHIKNKRKGKLNARTEASYSGNQDPSFLGHKEIHGARSLEGQAREELC